MLHFYYVIVAFGADPSLRSCDEHDQIATQLRTANAEVAFAETQQREMTDLGPRTSALDDEITRLRVAGPDVAKITAAAEASDRDFAARERRAEDALTAAALTPPDTRQIDAEIRAIDDAIARLWAGRATAEQDMKAGLFCSNCGKSKSYFEGMGESFEAHLTRVRGKPVPGSPQQVKAELDRWDDKIRGEQAKRDAAVTRRAQVIEKAKKVVADARVARDRVRSEHVAAKERTASAMAAAKATHAEGLRRLEAQRDARQAAWEDSMEAISTSLSRSRGAALGLSVRASETAAACSAARLAEVREGLRARARARMEAREAAARLRRERREALADKARAEKEQDADADSHPVLAWARSPAPARPAPPVAVLPPRDKPLARFTSWLGERAGETATNDSLVLRTVGTFERMRGLAPSLGWKGRLLQAAEPAVRETLARSEYEQGGGSWTALTNKQRAEKLLDFELKNPYLSISWVRGMRKRAWDLFGLVADEIVEEGE